MSDKLADRSGGRRTRRLGSILARVAFAALLAGAICFSAAGCSTGTMGPAAAPPSGTAPPPPPAPPAPQPTISAGGSSQPAGASPISRRDPSTTPFGR